MFDYEYTGKCFFGNLIMLIVNIKELCLVMQEKKNPSELEYMKLEFHFDLEYKGASLAF